jgi:hypothetical protein
VDALIGGPAAGILRRSRLSGGRPRSLVTPEQWARVNTVFHAALEQPPDARVDWLSRSVADDGAVRREVEALLAAHERAPEFLDAGAQADAASVDDRASLVGRRLGGYEVTRELGRGGMAIVYLAHDPRLRRDVAIKVVRGGGPDDLSRRERLRREARAVALLAHPGIATIYSLEEHGDELYIVTEYVRGKTLRDELARGRLRPESLLDTAIDIATVIAAAHAKGIIHRDLKPENVMRTPSGAIKILDFGLARASGSWAAEIAPTLTHAGGLLGTPAYMAPEQIRGTEVDERADVFALGILFYELACGAHPFGRGSIATTLHRILSEPPTPLSEQNCWIPWLDPILERCFKKDPAGRYDDAGHLLQSLLAACSDQHRDWPMPHTPDGTPGSTAAIAPPVSDVAVRAAYPASAPAAAANQGADMATHQAAGQVVAGPTAPTSGAGSAETGAPASQWWWQFHQLAAAAFLVAVVVPAWQTWEWISQDALRTMVRVTMLVVVAAAVSLRLHVSRYDPAGLREQRPRADPWIRLADWGFALAMLAGALAILPAHAPIGAVFLALSVCYTVVFLVVEPATARAAFRHR